MLLSEFVLGQSGIVKKLNNSTLTKKRLNHLGIVDGVKIKLVRIAPTGDPIQIKVRDFNLAIRKIEASKIDMEIL